MKVLPSIANDVSGNTPLDSSNRGSKSRYRAEKCPINNFFTLAFNAISPACKAVV